MAQSTRPQLASAPNMADFSSAEQTTLLAAARAAGLSTAPLTVQARSLLAPSPSAAMALQSVLVTAARAAQKAS